MHILKTRETGPAMSMRPWVRCALLADIVLWIAAGAWCLHAQGTGRFDGGGALYGWLLLGAIVLGAACALASLGLRPWAMGLRRVAGLVFVGVLLDGARYLEQPHAKGFILLAVLWHATIWIVFLLEGRRISRAIVELDAASNL